MPLPFCPKIGFGMKDAVSPNVPATAGARTQGVGTGEMDELIAAIRAGAAYVNVHSDKWPGGEIRKQINGNSGQ